MNNLALLFSTLFVLHGLLEDDNSLDVYFPQLTIGLFQFILSLIMVLKMEKGNAYLDLHFAIGIVYIFLLIGLEPRLLKENALLLFGLIPIKIAFFFTFGIWKRLKVEDDKEKQLRKNSQKIFVLDESPNSN